MPRTPAGASEARALTETVNRLRRVLRAGIRTDISWESLPMAQVEVLQSLVEASPARVNELTDRLRLAQSTVSGLVGQMMTAGLLARDVDPTDRRAAVVTVTDQGRRRLAEWEQAHVRRIQAAFAHLSEEERGTVTAALPALQRLTRILAEE